MKSQTLKFVIVLLMFSLTHYSFSAIRHVPADYLTIQSAVNASLDGDTVLLQAGTYYERVVVNFRQLTLAGSYLFSHDTLDRDQTVITIPDSVRNGECDIKSVVYVHHSDDFRLIGLTIRDGLGTIYRPPSSSGFEKEGGCIYADTTRLTLTGCRIVGGISNCSGGMQFQTGSIFLTESVFDSNYVIDGPDCGSCGALFADADTLIFLKCGFWHNHAYSNGAFIAQARQFGKIDSCSIIENFCVGYFGGMLTLGVTEICGNQIIGNRATSEAGFVICTQSTWGGPGLFANNIVKDNLKYGNGMFDSGSSGGFFQIERGQVWEIVNNVFENNVNENNGEGVLMLQAGNFNIHHNKFVRNRGGRFSTCVRILSFAQAMIDSNIFAYNICTNNPHNSAIQFRQWRLTIRHNDFYGNSPYAIYDCDSTFSIDSLHADHNWWGDASGPSSSNNPGGRGDSVDYRIPYMPWLTSSVFPMAIKEPTVTGVPTQLKLFQIAPNPFNSTTTIRFDVAHQSEVEVTLFDITGRKVETLFREHLSAGTHTSTFRGERYASGTYFVHLRIGNQSQLKKVVLLK